jgi:hypothetical protein
MSAPHDVPSVRELVTAVREFLERDVVQGTEDRLRFHARVAANALGVVERELALGPEHERAHRERLARLGVSDEEELAAAIRSGRLDDRLDDVIDVVGQTVRDKLLVANPKYVETPEAPSR